jgi:hypothetical protein
MYTREMVKRFPTIAANLDGPPAVQEDLRDDERARVGSLIRSLPARIFLGERSAASSVPEPSPTVLDNVLTLSAMSLFVSRD